MILFGSRYFKNGSSENFFKIDDPRSVLNGLSKKNGTLTVICPRAFPGEPFCTVEGTLCRSCAVTFMSEVKSE